MSAIKWDTMKDAEALKKDRYEAEANKVRSKRDRLLKETDHYVLPDCPKKPLNIIEIRQKLRDVTEQSGFPFNVVWPEIGDENGS